LKPGQRAAIVIRLNYEEERQKRAGNSLANLKQGDKKPDYADLQTREMSGRLRKGVAEHGQTSVQTCNKVGALRRADGFTKK